MDKIKFVTLTGDKKQDRIKKKSILLIKAEKRRVDSESIYREPVRLRKGNGFRAKIFKF